MNVHKRCKDYVANTCGINPRLMAEILRDMGMSVGKLSLPKVKLKKIWNYNKDNLNNIEEQIFPSKCHN